MSDKKNEDAQTTSPEQTPTSTPEPVPVTPLPETVPNAPENTKDDVEKKPQAEPEKPKPKPKKKLGENDEEDNKKEGLAAVMDELMKYVQGKSWDPYEEQIQNAFDKAKSNIKEGIKYLFTKTPGPEQGEDPQSIEMNDMKSENQEKENEEHQENEQDNDEQLGEDLDKEVKGLFDNAVENPLASPGSTPSNTPGNPEKLEKGIGTLPQPEGTSGSNSGDENIEDHPLSPKYDN